MNQKIVVFEQLDTATRNAINKKNNHKYKLLNPKIYLRKKSTSNSNHSITNVTPKKNKAINPTGKTQTNSALNTNRYQQTTTKADDR